MVEVFQSSYLSAWHLIHGLIFYISSSSSIVAAFFADTVYGRTVTDKSRIQIKVRRIIASLFHGNDKAANNK